VFRYVARSITQRISLFVISFVLFFPLSVVAALRLNGLLRPSGRFPLREIIVLRVRTVATTWSTLSRETNVHIRACAYDRKAPADVDETHIVTLASEHSDAGLGLVGLSSPPPSLSSNPMNRASLIVEAARELNSSPSKKVKVRANI